MKCENSIINEDNDKANIALFEMSMEREKNLYPLEMIF